MASFALEFMRNSVEYIPVAMVFLRIINHPIYYMGRGFDNLALFHY